MIWVWIIVGAIVIIFVFMLVNAKRGVNYWKQCEVEYANLISNGYSMEGALLAISMKRHPELALDTHKEIIDKFDNVSLLVNFFEGALPDANFSDEIALEILRDTTINPATFIVRTKRTK